MEFELPSPLICPVKMAMRTAVLANCACRLVAHPMTGTAEGSGHDGAPGEETIHHSRPGSGLRLVNQTQARLKAAAKRPTAAPRRGVLPSVTPSGWKPPTTSGNNHVSQCPRGLGFLVSHYVYV